jgi:uncharacterized RDD family membrane protein YckC
MYCPNCGTPNTAGAEKCTSCGNLLPKTMPTGDAMPGSAGQQQPWTPTGGAQPGQPGSQYNYNNAPPAGNFGAGSYNNQPGGYGTGGYEQPNYGGYNPAAQQPYYAPTYAMPGTGLARNYAGFWLRFGAYLIDAVIVGVVTSIIFLVPFFGYFGTFFNKYQDTLLRYCDSDSRSYSNAACNQALEDILINQNELGAMLSAVLIPALIGALISYGYYTIMTARGGTLGKMAFGLRVIKEDGSNPGFGRALLRSTIGYWISAAIFYLGFIWIGIDERKQGWHDKLSGTYVVRKN